MKLYEDYKIDGLPLLVPDADVSISQNDLDSSDSGRDESGIMHRQVVRYRVKTWGFNYSTLTVDEYRYMESLFAGKKDFTFSYRDLDGSLKETRAYCSNNSITYHNAKLGLYKNLKFNIIEC